jgi:uncharacterized protein YcbK (DUF882 family)
MRYTTIRSKLFALLLSIAGLFSLNTSTASASASAPSPAPEEHRLRLFHTHTGERIDIVYKVGDTYIPSALSRLNNFLRDHRTGDVHVYDPREFDLLEAIEQKLGRPHAEINIICGYRTSWSNAFLRARSSAVAQHSLHMQAMAIDIRIPGVTTAALRDAALSLHRGGVGYYAGEQFVHVDVGRVRRW